MIEKMKKLTFLVTDREYETFLSDIREMGVVHVQELQHGRTSESLQAALNKADRFKSAVASLDFAKETYDKGVQYEALPTDVVRGAELLGLIEQNLEKHNAQKHQIDQLEKTVAQLEPWGDFDPQSVARLDAVGCCVHYFVCATKMFKAEWRDEYFATPISEHGGKCYFVTFSTDVPNITAERLYLPSKRLSEYRLELKNAYDKQAENEAELFRIQAEERDSLLAAMTENENAISLSKVHLSSESLIGDSLKMMVGWVLAEKTDELAEMLDQKHMFYEIEDPQYEDDVPVKIKNGWYSSLFEPILRMYSLPNYHDLDPTPLFAPFFMLFFGLCMGDAGYGALIFIVSLILKKKLSDDMKGFAHLGMFLGAMTIVCGALTGSMLGIDLTQQDWAFLAPIKPYFINENNFKIFGYSPMMVISVIIGFIQVLVGMCMAAAKAAKLNGWRFAIGKMSWVVALLTAVACFGLPACGVTLPLAITYILYGVIGICTLGIFFYSKPDKNIFINFGSGLWDTYGMATGLLGDLLSYIRLFALGLTGGVLGGVFNTLAFDLTETMPLWCRWLPLLLILLLGHGMNFALCMISSFVHPMRLTFVEFFKNADFEGGGKEYSPFRIKTYKK
jgi:V/A-type H+-transporting ATPase subunit I